MIMRKWHGTAARDKADDYLRHLQESVLPEIGAISGHRGAFVLRQDVERGVRFTVLTLWDSIQSVRAFAGDSVERAVVPPEARRLLSDYDDRVEHLDVAFSTP